MSEAELKDALEAYEAQLAQIEQLLSLEPNESELAGLKSDLEDLIKLTKDSLLEVKRKNLLDELDRMVENRDDEAKSSKEINENDNDCEIDMSEVIGSKCRIPYNCQVTNLKMHNAIVLGVSSLEKNTVDVVFSNPTQATMKICKYFLEESCKFDKECKHSHGYEISVDKLEPYKEQDLNDIQIGRTCLAKHGSDGLWHLATIESIDMNEICVQYKKFNKVEALPWESVLVFDDLENDSSDDDDDDDEIVSKVDFEPRSLNTSSVGIGLGNLGNWEKHTKGIGSKLMSKMGYIPGHGLGPKGEGRVQPIDVYVLPAGKSLDKIMELKEKKLLKKEKFKPKEEKKADEEEINVFEFINKTLTKNLNADKKQKEVEVKIEAQTSKNLKIEMLKTHEEIQNIEKNIVKLKQSLERNKNSDGATIANIKQNLVRNEQKLAGLKKSESKIKNEQSKRKDKSEIF